MNNIDEIDRQLIGHLRKNARASVSWLANQTRVSRATVQNRLNRLESRGIIAGYTLILHAKTDEQMASVRAHMSLEIKGNKTSKVRSELLQLPNVMALHSTNGRWDMIVELLSRSLQEFDQVLKHIRALDGVASSETSILLSSKHMATQDDSLSL